MPILMRLDNATVNVGSVKSIQTLTNQKWYHLAMTRQGSSASAIIKLYINGRNTASTGIIDNRTAMGTDSLTIGSGCVDSSSVDRSFDGKIDEVQIYNLSLIHI